MTPEQLRQKPNTVRLRSGVQVVNGITGETGPTFSEYVLLSDYEDLQRAHAAALEEIAMLNGALSKIAEYIEPHWKGAGLDLNGAWLLEEIAKRGDALEQAERRAERLKGHAEAMAPVGMLEPLRIIGDRLLAHYGDRFCLTRPTLHTDNERQVLVAALKALRAGLAYRADKGE